MPGAGLVVLLAVLLAEPDWWTRKEGLDPGGGEERGGERRESRLIGMLQCTVLMRGEAVFGSIPRTRVVCVCATRRVLGLSQGARE